MGSTWGDRGPCVLERSGHRGTVVLVLTFLLLAAVLGSVL